MNLNMFWSNSLDKGFNKAGFDMAYEDATYVAFNKKNVVVSFNKKRNYAVNTFKVTESGEIRGLGLDIEDLRLITRFLKKRGIKF